MRAANVNDEDFHGSQIVVGSGVKRNGFVRQRALPSSVIPQVRRVAAPHGAVFVENCEGQKPEMFPRRVKFHLARGSHHRMTVQDGNGFSGFARQPFQPLAQFQFFAGEQFFAEAADFPERRRVAENK
jgi:hypothetical protein